MKTGKREERVVRRNNLSRRLPWYRVVSSIVVMPIVLVDHHDTVVLAALVPIAQIHYIQETISHQDIILGEVKCT
jgi:hypothetical protein